MKTIKELVLSAKNGNKKAFDKLYKLTSNDVWFTCVSLLKDEENAKDIMQETYITAFLKLDTLKVQSFAVPPQPITFVKSATATSAIENQSIERLKSLKLV